MGCGVTALGRAGADGRSGAGAAVRWTYANAVLVPRLTSTKELLVVVGPPAATVVVVPFPQSHVPPVAYVLGALEIFANIDPVPRLASTEELLLVVFLPLEL